MNQMHTFLLIVMVVLMRFIDDSRVGYFFIYDWVIRKLMSSIVFFLSNWFRTTIFFDKLIETVNSSQQNQTIYTNLITTHHNLTLIKISHPM